MVPPPQKWALLNYFSLGPLKDDILIKCLKINCTMDCHEIYFGHSSPSGSFVTSLGVSPHFSFNDVMEQAKQLENLIKFQFNQ